MREIKFRQAIFLDGKFYLWHYWGYVKDNVFDEPIRGLENCKLSQEYTGLKDKNGKEIYEGDVIQWWNGRELIGDAKVIEPTNGGWNPFIDDCQTDGSWHFVIIGNVYENPELLRT